MLLRTIGVLLWLIRHIVRTVFFVLLRNTYDISHVVHFYDGLFPRYMVYHRGGSRICLGGGGVQNFEICK